ncbi:DNA primase, phage associated, partial [hydrothermal vent metagenome]
MARISDNSIERLKQDIAIQRLAERRGIVLKRHGNDLIGLCPFHDDHEPSLVISPKKNLWHCLGVCQMGGSVIDWVMKAEGVSFRHAVELLQAGQPLAASTPVKHSTVRKLPTLEASAEDQALLQRVMDYYHEALKQTPDALAYLQKRGLTGEAMDHFKLGYANRTLAYRLPKKNRKAGADIRQRLQALGILRSSGHEHFNGSLVIPVINDGQVLEVYGRKLRDDLRPGTPKHLYLPGPHQGVFNVEALAASKEVILCESLIDALTFWCAGYRHVTASYGVEGFTQDHLQAFKDHGTERVLIAYDRDAAGNKAAEALAKPLNQSGMDCYRIQFPKGMDANAYALQVTPADKSLGVVIRSAEWMGDVQGSTSAAGGRKPRAANGKPKPRPAAKKKSETVATTVLQSESSPSLAASLAAAEPLPATPLPTAPDAAIEADIKGDDIHITLGDRHYRIRGVKKNLSHEQLKINLLASREDQLHVDSFDLYAARVRAAYIKQAAVELCVTEAVIKKDLGKVLLKLETLQDEHLQQTLSPEKSTAITLSEADSRAALSLLNDKKLLERILTDFSRCGVVGEETNKLVGYLACVSRKLTKPLAILIQSTSAAGKTSLMEAVLALMPEEDRVQYSAMTGQSLFYLGEADLKHKILAIAEEEGAHQAAYALKLLQSEGSLTMASTGKDPESGRHTTQEYTVEGPVMLFLTTTAIEIDEELMNRCLVLSVDENRAQTQAIHTIQRKSRTLDGLRQKAEKDAILSLHRNAQRLLRPLAVVNPYAERLTFLDDRTRTRRDHEKYLTLIETITLLHQYQRPSKTVQHNHEVIEYIEVTLADIEVANRLAHEVLGRSLDELPPQTRRLLQLIDTLVKEKTKTLDMQRADYRFSRKDVRTHTGWTDFQVKTHIKKLEALEYLLVHRGSRGQSFVYELLYDGQGEDGQAFLMGLIDTKLLKQAYDKKKEGLKPQLEGSSSPQVAPKVPSSWS